MRRWMSAAVVMCMMAPAVGLAGQGSVVSRGPGYWQSYAEKLPIGSTVRLRTTDGRRHTAVLAVVDRDGVTVELKTRIPEPPRRFAYDEIQRIELKDNGSGMVKAVALGAAVGAGTFLALLAMLAASWD